MATVVTVAAVMRSKVAVQAEVAKLLRYRVGEEVECVWCHLGYPPQVSLDLDLPSKLVLHSRFGELRLEQDLCGI